MSWFKIIIGSPNGLPIIVLTLLSAPHLGSAEDTSPAEAGAWGWVRLGIAFVRKQMSRGSSAEEVAIGVIRLVNGLK